MIAGGDTELRVAVDDARHRARERDVGEQTDHEPSADGRTGDRGDDRCRAVEHVVDEVARLVEDAQPRVGVVGDREHEVEIAAGAERAVGPADEDGAGLLVLPDRLPDACELAVLRLAHGVEAARRAEREPQDSVLRPVEVERRELAFVWVRRHGQILRRGATLARRGPVAQLVEQGTFNPKVAGSIPARPIRGS